MLFTEEDNWDLLVDIEEYAIAFPATFVKGVQKGYWTADEVWSEWMETIVESLDMDLSPYSPEASIVEPSQEAPSQGQRIQIKMKYAGNLDGIQDFADKVHETLYNYLDNWEQQYIRWTAIATYEDEHEILSSDTKFSKDIHTFARDRVQELNKFIQGKEGIWEAQDVPADRKRKQPDVTEAPPIPT